MKTSKKKSRRLKLVEETENPAAQSDGVPSEDQTSLERQDVSELAREAARKALAGFDDEVSESAVLEAEVDVEDAEDTVFEVHEDILEMSENSASLLEKAEPFGIGDLLVSVQEQTSEEEIDLSGTELDSFESAEVEDVEFLEFDQIVSIVESLLFASDRPQSLATLKQVFRGTNVKTPLLKKAIEQFGVELASANRGVTLHEVAGGYQLRTKLDNVKFLKQLVKARPFKLSGAALETLAILAYKQPITKFQVDEIRGVESGHLIRGLMERGLVNFEGKSELPGKPMLYGTTKKFLEIFGLRNLRELPSLSEIDQLLPDGIGELEAEKPTLDQLTDQYSEAAKETYSEGEEELLNITEKLAEIETTSSFFEEERRKEKERENEKRAQNIREALMVGEEISDKDRRWLDRYEKSLQPVAEEVVASEPIDQEPAGPEGQV